MHIYQRIFLLLFILFFNMGLVEAEEGHDSILIKRLDVLQTQMKAMKSEMDVMRNAIIEIHRKVVVSGEGTQTIDAQQPSNQETYTLSLDENTPSLGSSKAAIGIVEYTDYQCPFCARFHTQTFPEIKKTFIATGKVQYFSMNYPLSFHAQAKTAAIAGNCAAKQGGFWMMKNGLFEHQKTLGRNTYIDIAKKTSGINMKKFKQCLDDPKQIKKVQLEAANSVGVSGTPTFFIGLIENGKLINATRLVGAQSFSAFAQIINATHP